jgi:hypothetical protein
MQVTDKFQITPEIEEIIKKKFDYTRYRKYSQTLIDINLDNIKNIGAFKMFLHECELLLEPFDESHEHEFYATEDDGTYNIYLELYTLETDEQYNERFQRHRTDQLRILEQEHNNKIRQEQNQYQIYLTLKAKYGDK